jgi:hypothetical protein
MDPLGTDSCRRTVPMEPPMSNGSMHHREPKSEIDDTRMILKGASCTIAACIAVFRYLLIRLSTLQVLFRGESCFLG